MAIALPDHWVEEGYFKGPKYDKIVELINATNSFNPATQDLDMNGFDIVNPLEIRYDGTSTPLFQMYRSDASNVNIAPYFRMGKDVSDRLYFDTLHDAAGALLTVNIRSYSTGGASAAGFGDFVFYPDNIEKMRLTAAGDLKIPTDVAKLYLGASDDLFFYHDGADSYMQTSTGDMYLYASGTGENNIGFLTPDHVKIQDIDDANAVLFDLDTSARTLTIGLAADPIATRFNGTTTFDTDTGTNPVYISRLGSTTQALKIWMDDTNLYFGLDQDEDFAHSVIWNSMNTFPDQWDYQWMINGDVHFKIDHDEIFSYKTFRVDSISAVTDEQHRIDLDPTSDTIRIYAGDETGDTYISIYSPTTTASATVHPHFLTQYDDQGSLGISTNAWYRLYANQAFTVSGAVGSYDNHDDLSILDNIQPHPTEKTDSGDPILDETTIPDFLKDKAGGRFVNPSKMASFSWGAIRQLHQIVKNQQLLIDQLAVELGKLRN